MTYQRFLFKTFLQLLWYCITSTEAKSRGLAKKTHAAEAQSADKFASLGKRKLIGQVLAARSHNDILVLTPRGTISRVSLKTALPPKAGDFIEAVGSVETDTYFLNLTRARWRKTGSLQCQT